MEICVCENEQQLIQLAETAKEIWNEYFISIITQEQIDYMVDKFQSYPALKKAIKEEHYTYFLAYEGDTMIGFCGVKPDKERLFLSKLYLKKACRGKGYASRLLKQAIAFAKEQKLTKIYLTCNKFNTHSLDVYKKKGFYEIDAVQTDIGHGFIMDDYILQMDIA